MLLICYSVSIRPTIEVISDCSIQESQLSMLKNAPKVINELRKDLSEIESKIGNVETNDANFQKILLQLIGKYCESDDVVLLEFPEKVSFINDDYKIETYTLVIGGTFHDLLKFVYKLEQQYKLGKLVSLTFERKENPVTKKQNLKAKIIIQHISKML